LIGYLIRHDTLNPDRCKNAIGECAPAMYDIVDIAGGEPVRTRKVPLTAGDDNSRA
jgi:hypothetical protein